jgi:hypothetical protein
MIMRCGSTASTLPLGCGDELEKEFAHLFRISVGMSVESSPLTR